MEQKSIGRRVKRLRDRKAWTQEHLADAAQVSVRTVQRAEEGVMSAETIKAIAGALDESVEAITNPPTAYPAITPVLYYDDPASIEWLVEVFGFEARMKIPGPDGRIVHAELIHGDGLIMIGVPIEENGWKTPRQLGGVLTQCAYVMVDDVDAHCAHSRSGGAKILSEPADVHGHRRYRTEDPEGHTWWFVMPL